MHTIIVEPPPSSASPEEWARYIDRLEQLQKAEPNNKHVARMLMMVSLMRSRKANPYHHGGGDERGGQFTTRDDSTVMFEAAPDPNNKELMQRWGTLSPEQKMEVSNAVVRDITPTALRLLHAQGTLENQFGGWDGYTNPSYALTIDDAHADSAAKLLGYALNQDAMAVVSDHALPGLDQVGVVVVGLPKSDMTLEGLGAHYENLAKLTTENGDMLINGFSASTNKNEMHILNFTGKSDEELAGLVDNQLGGKYTVYTDKVYSTLIGKDQYSDGNQETEGPGSASWRENADSLRETATRAINGELKRRGKSAAQEVNYDRFVWDADVADSCFTPRHGTHKFNPNHLPAGSPDGGQFTTDGGAGNGGAITVRDRFGREVPINPKDSLYRWIIKRPDGTYGIDPTRELLHQQIVNKLMDGAVRQNGPLNLYMTGGGPASGKTTALKSLLPDDALHVDPDQIKSMLPEWSVLTAAGDKNAGAFLHEESSLVRKQLEEAAVAGNYNVILDTTGDSSVENLTANLAKYHNAGYQVHAYYATVDPEVAVARANQRGLETGRYVAEDVIRTTHSNVSHTFPLAAERGLFDEYRLYDTNSPIPKEIAGGTKGSPMKVYDRSAYDRFLSYGGTYVSGRATKSASAERVPTDLLTKMVVAITLGSPSKESMHLGPAASDLWDRVAAQIAACPEGQYVDPGNELTVEDLTNLYSGPLRKKFATTAGALDRSIQWVPIKKTDGEKQIVYGEVYAPYVLDTYGEFMTPEDIELMAHRFMQLDLSKVIDTQHDNMPNGSHPVESFIAREGDADYTPGSWVLGVHIPDPGLWNAVKKGLLNGFSFQSLVKPTSVDVEIDAIRDFVGDTELSEDHSHTFYVELDDIGNVVGGRTSKAADGHYHDIRWASVTNPTSGHSHRFFL